MIPDETIQASVHEVFKKLLILAAIIVGLDIAAMVFSLVSGHDHVFGLLGVINLDGERGIGTIFQVFLLLANAIMFTFVARAAKQGLAEAGPWLFLSFVFFFLALDEFAFLHERLMPVMRTIVGSSGILYFPWIVPYGIAVALLGLWIAPKIFRLSNEIRPYFIWAAIAYVSGAIGMEALGGWRMDVIGGESARPELIYESITTIEEGLEMLGLIILFRVLLGMLTKAYPKTYIEWRA